MWTLTSEDIRTAKTRAMDRRSTIEKELNEIDAELSILEALEQSASAFNKRYCEGDASNSGKGLQAPGQAPQGVTNWGSSQLVPASAKAS